MHCGSPPAYATARRTGYIWEVLGGRGKVHQKFQNAKQEPTCCVHARMIHAPPLRFHEKETAGAIVSVSVARARPLGCPRTACWAHKRRWGVG